MKIILSLIAVLSVVLFATKDLSPNTSLQPTGICASDGIRENTIEEYENLTQQLNDLWTDEYGTHEDDFAKFKAKVIKDTEIGLKWADLNDVAMWREHCAGAINRRTSGTDSDRHEARQGLGIKHDRLQIAEAS